MSSPPVVPTQKTTDPITITQPIAGGGSQEFDGIVIGTYHPASTDPQITCEFWRSGGSTASPPPPPTEGPIPSKRDYPSTGEWYAVIPTPGIEVTGGFLRASRAVNPANDERGNLHISGGGAFAPAPEPDPAAATASPPAPPASAAAAGGFSLAKIHEPKTLQDVGRLIVVVGEFDPRPGESLRLEFLHDEGGGVFRPALGVVHPPVKFDDNYWGSAIVAYEGGTKFHVRASLLSNTGAVVHLHNVRLGTIS